MSYSTFTGRIDGQARTPGWKANLGIQAATTTNADDSIKITSADGTALSSTNPGYITLPGQSAGQLETFEIIADITIDLTGAHWGLGTNGDQTDYSLSVYAINDAGTVKWGIGTVYGHSIILGVDDIDTATSATQINHIFVTSALSADSPCIEVAHFKANFDDTGGAAEDLWTVQTGTGAISLQPQKPVWKPWFPTGTWVTNTTYTGLWQRRDGTMHGKTYWATSGTPTATTLDINLMSGVTIDTAQLINGSDVDDHGIGLNGSAREDTGSLFVLTTNFISTTAVRPREINTGSTNAAYASVNNASPFTWGANDDGRIEFIIPITGWS